MNFIEAVKTYSQDFFSKGQSRTIAAKKNIAGSFIIRGFSIAISFILVPLTINYVNSTQYGIWLTLSSMVAWISFFDIGFGHGLRNRLAEAFARGDDKQARKYVSTIYALLAIIFGLIFFVFSGLNIIINWERLLNAPNGLANELSKTAFIIFGFFCLQMVLKIISTIILADQKPSLSNLIDMFGQLLGLGFVFFLSRFTNGSLFKLGFAIGSAQTITLILASAILFNGKYKKYRPAFSQVQFKEASHILNLGIKFFIIQVAAIVIFQTTNMIISRVMGPVYVTIYNIAYKYFFSIAMAFTIILTPFWSAFTDAYTQGDIHWMRMAVDKLKRVWFILVPICGGMLIVSPIVYRVWVGNSVHVPFIISFLISIYVLLFTRFNLFIYLINGIGKIQIQLYINLVIAILYIPLAVCLIKWMGLAGIIIASILVSLLHAIISQLQISKILNKDASGIWNK